MAPALISGLVGGLLGLALAVILLTHLMVVMGGVRARRAAAAAVNERASRAAEDRLAVLPAVSADAGSAHTSESSETPPLHPSPVEERASKRWMLHAGLLGLPARAGPLAWYAKDLDQRGVNSVQRWLHSHSSAGH